MPTDPRLVRREWRGRTNVDAMTAAMLEAAERDPVRGDHRHLFTVTQGGYQPAGEGDPLSMNTHGGAAVDLVWCGHAVCLLALRRAGFAAWHRTPREGRWPDHVHAIPLDHPRVSPSAARQVAAYLAGRNGLRNNGPDTGPRLDPIPRPVWPPNTQEDDDMPYRDWPKEDREALAADVAAAVLGTKITVRNPSTGKDRSLTVQQAMKETLQTIRRDNHRGAK